MNSPLKKIYTQLKKKKLDALLVSSPANISYLIDSPSRDAYFLVSEEGKNIYFTDPRYTEEAGDKLKTDASIEKINGSVFKIIAGAIRNLNFKRIGFEEKSLIFGEYIKIKEELRRTAALVPTRNLVEELRQIKSREELSRVKKAVQVTIKAMRFIEDFISVGKKEIEIAAELERFIRYNGADGCAFETIVASGPNSSYPHHKTSRRKLRHGEPVLVDIGVDYQGYKSDLTRVFFSGKMSFPIRNIYNIVLKAQDKAMKLIKAGVCISRIDAASRQYITARGYGRQFLHSLGHGVGLEIHEAPCISSQENGRLEEGMVFTVEPAVYLPSKFGIRLEDMVVVTKSGCEVLSGSLRK